MEPECRIQLEVFEGPLDLLLHLINRNRLSITDISISLVTNQYLEYLELLKALDIEVAAEYLVMAVTLMQIKSRMLLPAPIPATDEEGQALEIIDCLEELKRVKHLADLLEQRPILERDVFLPETGNVQPGENCPCASDVSEQNYDVTILDLIDAFKAVLGSRIMPRTMEILRARVDMAGRIEEIENKLHEKKKIEFSKLVATGSSRHVIIVTFLAILELAKRGIVRLVQDLETETILLVLRQETLNRNNTP